MIVGVAHVALLVRDHEEAKRFYCGKLGFRVAEDSVAPSGKTWIRLAAPGGGGTDVLLSLAAGAEQLATVGRQAAGRVFLFLHTDDLLADYEELRSRGVEFTEEPRSEPYGQVAVFKDLYGNRIDLIQPKVP